MKKVRKNPLIFWILGIFLLVLGAIFVLSSIPNLMWKKITSSEINCEFKYPVSWIIELNHKENGALTFIDYSLYTDDDSETIRITAFPYEEPKIMSDTMKAIYQEIYRDYLVVEEGKITVDNREAYQRKDKYIDDKYASGPAYVATVVTYVGDSKRLYSIVLIERSKEKFQDSLAIYNRIVDSFHILTP